jgi:hypothetical protein
MRVELNRLSEYIGRTLLCVRHSERPMEDPTCDINYLEKRFASPFRLPPQQPFDMLRPSHDYSPYSGSISIYDVGDDGRREPQLVCAFRPDAYKPQHALWLSDRLWVLAAEHIEVYDAALHPLMQIRDPWLAGNHTIAADENGRLIVSSAASDSVLTVDAGSGEVTRAWRVPEAVFGENYALARDQSVVDHYITNDIQVAHVNCAWPWRGGVITTSLIRGAVGWFDAAGRYREVVRGFVGCHGARVRTDVDEIYFCDSCSGMVVFVDFNGNILRRVGTRSHWLQDAVQVRGDLFAMAPFDRNEVILMDITTKNVVSRIPCAARGGAQFLSFGSQPRRDTPARPLGHRADEPSPIDAALRAQRAAMVAARDELVAKHAAAIGERDRMAQKAAEIEQALTAEIARRDAIIADANAAIGVEIGRRDAIIAEMMERMAAEVTRRDRIIGDISAQMSAEVGRRDAMLAEQQATFLDRMAAYERQVADRDAAIVELRDRVAGLERAATRGWRGAMKVLLNGRGQQ